MQFPRAPRFVEKGTTTPFPSDLSMIVQLEPDLDDCSYPHTAPSGVPGPGSYNPRSPQGTEKKGLLNVVQAERFDSKENNNPSELS